MWVLLFRDITSARTHATQDNPSMMLLPKHSQSAPHWQQNNPKFKTIGQIKDPRMKCPKLSTKRNI